MSPPFKLRLSYNEIDREGLSAVLLEYAGRPHEAIVHDFEARIAAASGSPFALATSSGTAALHLALKVLGVKPGDTVAVSTFTYVASVNPIAYCGATPVFIDSEPDTWNMSPDLLAKALKELASQNKLPKAIIVVHVYGNPARMDLIMEIARYWNIPVIEDAAEALGTTIENRWVGTFGEMGIFSFNNNKTITTFGGGALTCASAEYGERARYLAHHARERKSFYQHNEIGFNYAMGPLNAAMGLAQWKQLNERVAARRNIFDHYFKWLAGHPGLEFQTEPERTVSGRWLSALCLPAGVDLEMICQSLEMQGIELRRVWNPIHRQGPYLGSKAFLDGTAEALFERGVCLPAAPSTQLAHRVVERLRFSLKQVFRV